MWQTAPIPDLLALLAILQARCGRPAEAAQALARARDLTAPAKKAAGRFTDGDRAPPWNHRVVRSLLMQEAEKAVAAVGKK